MWTHLNLNGSLWGHGCNVCLPLLENIQWLNRWHAASTNICQKQWLTQQIKGSPRPRQPTVCERTSHPWDQSSKYTRTPWQCQGSPDPRSGQVNWRIRGVPQASRGSQQMFCPDTTGSVFLFHAVFSESSLKLCSRLFTAALWWQNHVCFQCSNH